MDNRVDVIFEESEPVEYNLSKGVVVFVREGEGLNRWGVVVIGYPELSRTSLTFEQAKEYKTGIESLKEEVFK